MPATIAIVGRPNVGKSTLFNRLVGKRLALVDDRPGVTRDRREGEARLGDLSFTIVDTAGLEDGAKGSLTERMRQQTETAIAQADAVLFVTDARVGVTPDDERFADLVRRSGKPVILLANKAESREAIAGSYDAFRLGLGDPLPFSAEHGEGLADLHTLLAPIVDAAAENDAEPDEELVGDERPPGPLRVAIVGRPNAGKSTLINYLLGEDRLLTGPEAGITRDSISVEWEWRGRPIKLFDTAGMRRKARIHEALEKLSVSDGIRAVKFAEIVVLLFDATIAFEKQDLHIADLCAREGRAVVFALSKWDLVEDRAGAISRHREMADRLLPQIKGAPLIAVSGMTGEGVDRLMDAIFAAEKNWNKRVSTAALNRWFRNVMEAHPPPAVSGRRIKLRYVTQAKTRPPHFILFGTRTDALPDSYVRYLVNSLRETFDMPGTPIRMTLREPENPYDRGR
ncbi:GTPase Der [Agaricicola taiwanensis]|uniref:GTPase Der n=1 Tax=Agaricicola taiwanensis TaxID=591372 RepID=A0A8J2YJH9_9RHOB|nr:ribosome biogenesis GTPase Der [Agaricicola taiwanensis]GGE47014.1 GTPase Der [Agaricicola taiwanensis]